MKNYQPDPPLFNGEPLSNFLDRLLVEARKFVDEWNDDLLLRRPEPDLLEEFEDTFRITVPTLLRDDIVMLPTSNELQPSPLSWSPDYGNAHKVSVRRFVIPFQGGCDVFKCQPQTRSLQNPPTGAVERTEDGGELTVALTLLNGRPQDARAIRETLEGALRVVEQHLTWAAPEVQLYLNSLGDIAARIPARRAEILRERDLDAELGLPIRRRADARTYAAPVRRKPLRVHPVTSYPVFAPEPALTEAAYEDALQVLRNGRNALERSPSMTAHLTEERIRDLLLLLLNAQFEGGAAGEVFNGSGKTDILIRQQDKNVFIAECKIWSGQRTVATALDQLLRYLVWRDTKAALLLFIRGGSPTDIMTKAAAAVESHPNYKRTRRPLDEDAERADFILHANDDPGREIQLALLPFVLSSEGGRARDGTAV